MSETGEVTALFLEFSRTKLLEQYWPRLRACVESLTDEQVWWRPNEACNSVGNLLLHLEGNVRQWLIASFNEVNDHRDRPAEFAAKRSLSARELVEKLGNTLQEASVVLSRLTDADLKQVRNVQGYAVTGLQAVYQVVEHFGMHYGQVLYITKLLKAESLGFYRELDKTGRLP